MILLLEAPETGGEGALRENFKIHIDIIREIVKKEKPKILVQVFSTISCTRDFWKL